MDRGISRCPPGHRGKGHPGHRRAIPVPRASLLLPCLIVLGAFSAPPLRAQEGNQGSGADSLPFEVSGLFYIAFQSAQHRGADSAAFVINRAYLTVLADVLPRLQGRVTFDTSQDLEGDGRGDMEVRLKYAYARYRLGDIGLLRNMILEGGIVHMVWLDFEEHVNLYRMRDPMFLERSGVFNSADFGVTVGADLGEKLPEEYSETVADSYAGRWGSIAMGLYNGGGYHGDERNTNKVLQGRLTFRPVPEDLPGFQLSGLAIVGKGNQPDEGEGIPDWRAFDAMLSYQASDLTATAQRVWGEGNQKGTWVEASGPEDAVTYSGTSLFLEKRLLGSWRLVLGLDDLTREQGARDLSFLRFHAGLGYDFGRGNILLLDWDRQDWDEPGRPVDSRVQVVMQVKF